MTSSLSDLARGVAWFWRGVTGADAYDRYCAHLIRTHPDRALPTKKEFWREKYDDQERNPRTRCC